MHAADGQFGAIGHVAAVPRGWRVGRVTSRGCNASTSACAAAVAAGLGCWVGKGGIRGGLSAGTPTHSIEVWHKTSLVRLVSSRAGGYVVTRRAPEAEQHARWPCSPVGEAAFLTSLHHRPCLLLLLPRLLRDGALGKPRDPCRATLAWHHSPRGRDRDHRSSQGGGVRQRTAG